MSAEHCRERERESSEGTAPPSVFRHQRGDVEGGGGGQGKEGGSRASRVRRELGFYSWL